MAKTKKSDFKFFQKCAESLIDILGIKQWDIDFVHQPANPGDAAWCSTNLEGMVAEIGLADEWSMPITEENLRRMARHEVFELFLAEMDDLARMRFLAEDRLNAARHRVIQTLLNIM